MPQVPQDGARALAFDGHAEAGEGARQRLIAAMAVVLTDKGYAQASVADVVRQARVSKRTFYEHFASRDECYLATYQRMAESLLALLKKAAASDAPAEQRLADATYRYLEALQSVPQLTRTFFTELQLAGPSALKAQRHAHDRMADVLYELIEQGMRDLPNRRPLSRDMALAVVGAVNELLIKRIDEGRTDQLRDLSGAVLELIRAILFVPAERVRPT